MNADGKGMIYLCATPIGNLEDMTFRGVRLLKEADVIAAEDTRHTRKLLSHYDIHTPLISYHEHNRAEVGPALVARAQTGETVVLVSDAGMPGISDPGADLVALSIKAGITVSPLPGPSAALSALICSGLDARLFTFIGFLPKTKSNRREAIASLSQIRGTLLLYEAPHRLLATLEDLIAGWGDRPAAAARELTKRYEEFVRGTLRSLQEHFERNAPRGEFVLVVSGASEVSAPYPQEPEQSVVAAVQSLIAAGTNKKDAIRKVASDRGVSRREIYQAVLAAERN